jgi:hypothetical protein
VTGGDRQEADRKENLLGGGQEMGMGWGLGKGNLSLLKQAITM